MTDIERITFSVTGAMAARMKGAIARGEYATTSEIVRDALRLWSAKQDERKQMLESLGLELRQALKTHDSPRRDTIVELRDYLAEILERHQENRAVILADRRKRSSLKNRL